MALIKTFFAKDPHLMVSFAAAEGWELEDNYRFYVAVDVLEADGTTWTEVYASEHTPDAAGVVKVNIRPACRGIFNPIPVNFATPYNFQVPREEFNRTIRVIRTRSGGVTGVDTMPISPTTTGEYLVILGGLSKRIFPQMETLGGFFTNYLGTMFMTWAPREKYVDAAQEDYLNFYFTSVPPSSAVRQCIKAYYSDGTTQTETMLTSSFGTWGLDEMQLRFATGPSNSGVYTIDPTKTLVKYDFWLANNSGVAISEVRTYIIDPVSYPNRRFILCLNSLGAWEVHRLYGDASERERYTRQIVRKTLSPGYKHTDGEYEQTSVEGQVTREMGSGYFLETNSRGWQLYMRDVMKSTRVYDVTKGQRVPIIITSAELVGPVSRNYKYAARFESIVAYSDEVYTPDEFE